MREIVLLDLFSGTGGFAKGLAEAGFIIKRHYFSEIDKYAIANYQYNFKNAKYVGKVEEVRKGKIERPDIITFGFPCQDLSVAGKRTGLKGKRSGLFFEAIRIIREFKPQVFVFENVKGLFSSNKGKDFTIILEAIAELGVYDCEWQLLNTRWFLPQNRERVYFIGHLRGKSQPKVFPIVPVSSADHKKQPRHVVGALTTRTGECCNSSTYIKHSKGKKDKKWHPLQRVRTDKAKAIRKSNLKQGRDYAPYADRKFVARKENILGTITTSSHRENLLTDKSSLRKITPVEAERLQGFPDNWTKFGKEGNETIEISDTQRYKLTGNAVSVPVVKAIAERLGDFKGLSGIPEIISLEARLINFKR